MARASRLVLLVLVTLLLAAAPAAVVLVLVAGIVAFETGVHSTHHLGQPDGVRQCVVAGVSAQLSADLVDASLDAAPVTLVHAPLAGSPTPVIAARSVAPHAGRAPPVLSA
jgi:hypothetical protein